MLTETFSIERRFNLMLCFLVFLLELSRSDIVTEPFEQKLDHSNMRDARTFTQYFDYDLQYAGDNWSSIVFDVPDLTPVSRLQERFSDSATEIAKQSHSVLVTCDIRYFGRSWPGNVFEKATAESFQYLTISQILADLASFIHSRTEDGSSRTFFVGGGYGGNIATWMRIKYPQYVIGSWSSSAPILIHTENSLSDKIFLSKLSYYDKPPLSMCYFRVGNVMRALNQSICMNPDQKSRSDILKLFELAPEVSNASAMYVIYQGLEMMNGQNDETKLLDLLCSEDLSVVDFANYVKLAFQWYRLETSELDPEKIFSDDVQGNVRDMKAFWKLKCYELVQFPVAVTTDPTYPFFRSPLFSNSSYYTGVCHKAFGIDELGDTSVTNAQYGGEHPGGKSGIFTMSQDDLTQQFMISAHSTGNEILILNSTKRSSPYADLRNSRPGEDPELTKTRELAISTAVDWLTGKCNDKCQNGKCISHQCICDQGYTGEWCASREIRASKIRSISMTATLVPTCLLLFVALIAWIVILREPEDAAVINFLR